MNWFKKLLFKFRICNTYSRREGPLWAITTRFIPAVGTGNYFACIDKQPKIETHYTLKDGNGTAGKPFGSY